MRVVGVALPSPLSGGILPELEPVQDVDVKVPVFINVSIQPECMFVPCRPNLNVEAVQSK